MSRCLLADRGVVIQLALPAGSSSPGVDKMLAEYDVLAVETGGASALRGALRKRASIGEKLYVVDQRDYIKASKVGSDCLDRLIAEAILIAGVRHETRKYIASRHPLVESDEEITRYVLKLFVLACTMQADIFVAAYRFPLFRSIIECFGELRPGTDEGGFAAFEPLENSRIFEYCGLTPCAMRVFALLDAAEQPTTAEDPVSDTHVFLSYCHDNTDQVRRLRDDLAAKGIKIWWDQEIEPGQDWRLEIAKALQTAGAFVLCLSAEAVTRQKSGLFPEALDAIARYREYRPGSTFIIPVRLSRCEIPMIQIDSVRSLSSLQYIDLFPDNHWDQNVDRLSSVLKGMLSSEPIPHVEPRPISRH